MKDYYKILDIKFGSDTHTIKKAYRNLALKYHPDRNRAHDAAQNFIKITEAYEVLRDPNKKQHYDRLYESYFKPNKQEDFFESKNKRTYHQKQQEWAEYGKAKAKEYSSIPIEEFARRLLKEINIGANYIPNLIAMLIVVGGAVGMIAFLPHAFNDSEGLGLFVIAIIFCLGYLAYRLFQVAQADYKEERKRKITNI